MNTIKLSGLFDNRQSADPIFDENYQIVGYTKYPNNDELYGPYDSVSIAFTALSSKVNGVDSLTQGKTVGVVENGSIVEYWFKDAAGSGVNGAYTLADLVRKQPDLTDIETEIANILNGTSDIMDKNIHLSQAQINQIVLGDAINVSLSASPSPIFVGIQQNINLVASISTNADTITIKKGETVIATGNGTSLSGTDTITPNVAGDTNYTANFIIGGLTKNASKSVTAVYPIRIGSGSSYVEGTPINTPKTSPAGTYNVTVATNADYIWFNVPATMSINRATMNGFDFPLENPTSVTINGIAYKSYRSSNTNDAGTYQIVVS